MNSLRIRFFLAASLLLTFALFLCGTGFSGENPGTKNFAKGNNQFSLDLYARLKKTTDNLFFSPYSISTVMAMTCNGARGKTRKEMAQVFHFPDENSTLNTTYMNLRQNFEKLEKKGSIQLNIANAMWCQKGESFLTSFTDTVQRYYGSGLFLVDFRGNPEGARKRINSWVEKETRNKIKDFFPVGSLSPMSRFVLTNAIYFKGKWEKEFNRANTRSNKFFITGKQFINVPMMYQKSRFKMLELPDMKIIQLPYAGNDLSMVIFLPGKVDGLAKLEKNLTPDNFEKWMQELKQIRPIHVRVFLPRFTMNSRFSLAQELKALGMPSAFSDADFSGINGKRNLFISDVIHKAFVDVNEEGTEAAAATGVTLALTSVMIRPVPEFRADHPFVFIIMDNQTGSILFMGRLEKPKKA